MLSPPDWERTALFAVCPAPSRVHATVCLSFSPVPLFGSLNYFDYQVPCREQEHHFGRVQVWTTFHEVVLWAGSWGLCGGAHQRPGYCLPVAFPATVISLCWGGCVFSDVRKGSSSIHIIPGLDFHREATRLRERALPCVFKVSLESLPTERGRFLCTEVRTGVEEVQEQIARYPPTLDVRPPGADTLSLEAHSVGTVWGSRLSHSSSALLSCFCIFTSGWRLCWQVVFCFQNFCFHIIWFSFPKSRSNNNYFCSYPLNIHPVLIIVLKQSTYFISFVFHNYPDQVGTIIISIL